MVRRKVSRSPRAFPRHFDPPPGRSSQARSQVRLRSGSHALSGDGRRQPSVARRTRRVGLNRRGTIPKSLITLLSDKHPTRCTWTKPIVSRDRLTTARHQARRGRMEANRRGLRRVCDHPLSSPWVLLARSQMHRRDSRMFPDAAGLHTAPIDCRLATH